jgi:Na+-driven multidrug efflux pump
MDQIRERVRALSSCCQQLGKFFMDALKAIILLTSFHLGMGIIIQVCSHICTYFLFPQVLPFPLSLLNGAIRKILKEYEYFTLCLFFLNLFFRVSQDSLTAFKSKRSPSHLSSSSYCLIVPVQYETQSNIGVMLNKVRCRSQ